MSDDGRRYALYLNELIRLYKLFNPAFDRSELNIYITDALFELLEEMYVSIDELEAFVAKDSKGLTTVIKPKNGLLFQQPAVILALYYFYNHQTFLRDNWVLNNEALKSIYKATSTSYETY
ncbi:MAG: hypothetical protein U0264_05470 [Candidatus Kapaibacterium sp.]